MSVRHHYDVMISDIVTSLSLPLDIMMSLCYDIVTFLLDIITLHYENIMLKYLPYSLMSLCYIITLCCYATL